MLPHSIQEILNSAPNAVIRSNGNLAFMSKANTQLEDALLRPTKWNLENNQPYNKLKSNLPWGIVLHWYGDRYPHQESIDFYLRGFDGMRQIGEFYTSTSAHFLVGDYEPTVGLDGDSLGIVQIQKPALDGVPYQAAHLRSLDHNAHDEGKHYFTLALNKLSASYPGVRSILQDFYAQPGVLAHMQTIAIEVTGFDFENPDHYPEPQKIANTLSLVWALMLRYRIPANNILGHLEIQLSKPDPGKKFLAMIKYLIGLKALVESNEIMRMLVFGQFIQSAGNPKGAVLAYFRYLREYLELTASPRQIFEWDAWSKFLESYDLVQEKDPKYSNLGPFFLPLQEPLWQPGYSYLVPDNHEGIDIYPNPITATGMDIDLGVHLLANGDCIHVGKSIGLHNGKLAVFRHRLEDGSEVISSYGHLDELSNIKVGGNYAGGQVIGKIQTANETSPGYLHFSLAYGPSWDVYLNRSANIPLNAGPTWIRQYFLNPTTFLTERSLIRENG